METCMILMVEDNPGDAELIKQSLITGTTATQLNKTYDITC